MAKTDTEFRERIVLFDMFSGGQDELRSVLTELTDHLRTPELNGPLYTVTHELVVNGLKAVYKKVFFDKFIVEIGLEEDLAVYKKVFFDKFIVEIGLEDIDYQKWLALFKSEIEAHNAENFSRMVRESNQGVGVSIRVIRGDLRIVITNPGRPSPIEMDRIRRSIRSGHDLDHLSPILEEAAGDENREGAGLGLALIIMSLRKLGGDRAALRITTRGDRTFAGISLRRELLEKYTIEADVDLT